VGDIRVVRAQGDGFDRGIHIGKELVDLIQASVGFYHRYLDRRGVSSEQLQDLLTPYLVAAETTYPESMNVLKGMSIGAMVPILELFAINAFEELEPLLESPEGELLFLQRKEGYVQAPITAPGSPLERCSSLSVKLTDTTLIAHNEHWLAGDLGNVAVLPGLVNAHTHLELSYLRDEVPPASEFVAWIRNVMAARRQQPHASAPVILEAMDRAIAESVAFGTAVVGDISNTLVSFQSLLRSPLAAVMFFEMLGFNIADAPAFVAHACRELDALGGTNRVRTSLAAHAPYSVAPLVFRAIRHAIDRDPFVPCSVHLSESAEEVEFILNGGGPWRQLLEEIGVWNDAWRPPGVRAHHTSRSLHLEVDPA